MNRFGQWAVVVAGCMCVAAVSGCRKPLPQGPIGEGPGGAGEGPITQTAVGGDIALGDRFADGRLVTNAGCGDSVLFAYDSYQVADTEMAKIEAVATYLNKSLDVKLVVEGHCDERGSNEYNMSLGEHRALAVRANLVRLGVDGGRVQTRSYGEEKAAAEGHDEAAWRQNRRVEFKLFKPGA